MKRSLFILVLAALMVFTLAAPVSAAAVPTGSCASGFELHEFHHHMEGEMEHHHIGIAQDLNGDGMICVKHLDNGLHVHADNVIR